MSLPENFINNWKKKKVDSKNFHFMPKDGSQRTVHSKIVDLVTLTIQNSFQNSKLKIISRNYKKVKGNRYSFGNHAKWTINICIATLPFAYGNCWFIL